jgi:hypothetical protein
MFSQLAMFYRDWALATQASNPSRAITYMQQALLCLRNGVRDASAAVGIEAVDQDDGAFAKVIRQDMQICCRQATPPCIGFME